jgi:hypothetical protein
MVCIIEILLCFVCLNDHMGLLLGARAYSTIRLLQAPVDGNLKLIAFSYRCYQGLAGIAASIKNANKPKAVNVYLSYLQ